MILGPLWFMDNAGINLECNSPRIIDLKVQWVVTTIVLNEELKKIIDQIVLGRLSTSKTGFV